MLGALKNVAIALAGFLCIFLLAIFLSPTDEQVRQRYALFCDNAADTPDHPFAAEECTLNQKYGMKITEWDLTLYQYRKVFGRNPPSGISLGDEVTQKQLTAHFAAHPEDERSL